MTFWSWVNQPKHRRPSAVGPGRYSRPLAERDQVIVAAFGKEVRRLRRLAKLSTRDLGRLVGMSQPAIVMLENNQSPNIELRLMWDFAEAFHVQPDHFLQACQAAVSVAEAASLSNKPTKTDRKRVEHD